MHDPYKSCWGCPKPRPCDRSACDGWQSREAEKQIEYDLRLRKQKSTPEHAGYKQILRVRARHHQMRGSGKT